MILQNIFTALKILCAPPLKRSPIGFQLYLKVLQHTLANIFGAPAVSLALAFSVYVEGNVPCRHSDPAWELSLGLCKGSQDLPGN